MIEQLQALMKALETGSYNHPVEPLEKKKMKFQVIDPENGQVLFSGIVDKYTITTSHVETVPIYANNMIVDCAVKESPKRVEISGILINEKQEIKEEQVHYLGKTSKPTTPDYFKPLCQHSWKQYSGFMDSYTYCEKCNEKK